MTRETRYETYTQEMSRTIEVLTCNGCGVREDVEPTKRNEGWFTVFWNEAGATKTRDFHEFGCLFDWVTERPEGPSDLLDKLQESLAVERAKREGVTR